MPMLTFLKLAPEEHLPHIPNSDPAIQRSQSLVSQDASASTSASTELNDNEPITPLTPVGGFLKLIPEKGAPWGGQPPEKEVVVGGQRGEGVGKKVNWEEKAEEGKRGKAEEKGKGTFAKLRRAFSVKRG